MKYLALLGVLFFLCMQSNAEEIKVFSEIKKNKKQKWTLTVTLANHSKGSVFLPNLNGKWIDIRLDLWSLGKGVSLYSKNDAEWRRQQAFVDYDWKIINSGEIATIVILIDEMMPDDPDNDVFSIPIIEEFFFLNNCRAYLEILFKSDSPDSVIAKKYNPVNLKK